MTNKTFAPFELKMTEQQAFDGLKSTYGNELTAADVRAFAAMNNIGYATVTKKIKKYRVCLLYTSPSPRDGLLSRMPSSA